MDHKEYTNYHTNGLNKFIQALDLIETAYGDKPQYLFQKNIVELIREWIRIVETKVLNHL